MSISQLYSAEDIYHESDTESIRRAKKERRKKLRKQFRKNMGIVGADLTVKSNSKDIKSPFNVIFGT